MPLPPGIIKTEKGAAGKSVSPQDYEEVTVKLGSCGRLLLFITGLDDQTNNAYDHKAESEQIT